MYNSLVELFSDPKRWCKGAVARDINGKSVSGKNKEAVSWCFAGGKMLLGNIGYDWFTPNKKVETVLKRRGLGSCVISFNNDPNTTHELFLDVLKEAGV